MAKITLLSRAGLSLAELELTQKGLPGQGASSQETWGGGVCHSARVHPGVLCLGDPGSVLSRQLWHSWGGAGVGR